MTWPLPKMRCPRCNSRIFANELKAMWADYCRSLIKRPSGGKRYGKHSPAAGSRCKCPACDEKRCP